jgi:ketosteroid isomerase-like protein
MQTQTNNIEIVKGYFDSLARGDLQKLGSLLADDIVWHQPGSGELSKTYRGKAEVFALFGKFMEISEGSFKIDQVNSIMANDDYVTATLSFSAKSNKSSIEMSGVDLMRVADGKIREVFLFSGDQAAEDAFWSK